MNDRMMESMIGGRTFDNPFMLPSNESMPTNFQSAMDVALFLYTMNPLYGQATRRVVMHFITDFDYPGDGSKEEQQKLDDYLHYTLKLPLFMSEVGDDWACYGNAYCRVHYPFDRFLLLPNGQEIALSAFNRRAKFNLQSMTYAVSDPRKKGVTLNVKFRDRPSTDSSRIVLRKLNPRYVLVLHNPISGTNDYVYRFEPELINGVKKGWAHLVDEMPMEMLDAIRKNQDFLFAPDSIFHFKAPTVSGITLNNIGIPGTLLNYRNLHQLQVYRKLDEAVGLDYMTPFRLFSPLAGSNPKEAFDMLVLGKWRQEVSKIIKNRRADKFAIHSLPFPVNYQEVGAQGKELTPKDLMEYQTGVFLDGLGYPQELFKGTLAYMQVPTAMRLFEQSFAFIHVLFNQLAQWSVRKVRAYLSQPPMQIVLQQPSIVDNLERRQLMFQLASMGEISRETAYDAFGVDDVVGEMKKRMEEDSQRSRMQAKMERELQTEMQSGAISAPDASEGGGGQGSLPGGPSVGGGNTTSPLDIQGQAQRLAEYWLSIPSDGQRSQAMQAQKAGKPELYALAKQMMEDMRKGGEQQGRAAVNQQAQQGGNPQVGGGQ